MAEIDQNGTLGRGRNNFRMRTPSQWLAQSFAVLVPASARRYSAYRVGFAPFSADPSV